MAAPIKGPEGRLVLREGAVTHNWSLFAQAPAGSLQWLATGPIQDLCAKAQSYKTTCPLLESKC